MMQFPEELAAKTKQLFPESKKLHGAIENRDIALVMGCLNELIAPMMNITNDWFMVKMETANSKDGNSEDDPLRMQVREFEAA